MLCSDLDRTLIYSDKFLKEMDLGTEVIVEYYDGEPLTYMSKKSIKLLKQINNKNLFIPVTTRTKEQYERIEIFQQEIKPKYAVVANGGRILENSKIDKVWENYIIEKLRNLEVNKEMVLKEFEKYKKNWVLKSREVKDKFLYFIIDRKKKPEDIGEFFKWLKKNNWNYSLQGRKLYFIPKFINKNSAVQYILEKENIKKYFATGDSFLDAGMINEADESLVPAHGELNESNLYNEMSYTENIGFEATEEILENYVENFINK